MLFSPPPSLPHVLTIVISHFSHIVSLSSRSSESRKSGWNVRVSYKSNGHWIFSATQSWLHWAYRTFELEVQTLECLVFPLVSLDEPVRQWYPAPIIAA